MFSNDFSLLCSILIILDIGNIWKIQKEINIMIFDQNRVILKTEYDFIGWQAFVKSIKRIQRDFSYEVLVGVSSCLSSW